MSTIVSREVLSPEQLGIIMPEVNMPGTPNLEALFASDNDKEKQHHDDTDVPMLEQAALKASARWEKSSNGAAEEAVAACVLLSAYEHHTGKKVGSQHPLHAWAVRHGSWILNRYCVSRAQQTPFEITFQSSYTGKLVEFGECMAMCRTAMT